MVWAVGALVNEEIEGVLDVRYYNSDFASKKRSCVHPWWMTLSSNLEMMFYLIVR